MNVTTLLLIAVGVLFTVADEASAHEKPRFNTSKYDRSVSHRQNVCDRQSIVFTGDKLRNALSGLDLSVFLVDYAGTDEEYLFALNSEGRIRSDYPGLFAVLLDELSRRAGFKWRDSYGATPPLEPLEDGNKTWADLLKWSVDTYDLSQEYWSKTTGRMDMGISFPEGWYDSSIILVDRAQSTSSSSKQAFDAFNFLRPFDLGLWGLIAAAIIFTGLMYWFLERIDGHSDARNLELMPGGAIFLSAIVFTSHFEFRPNTHAARILSWSWSFWAVIVGSAYTANLASFLVTRSTPSVGVQSMEEAVQRKMPICIQQDTAQYEYVKNNYPRANVIRCQTEEETFDGLFTGECQAAVTIMSSFQRYERRSEVNRNCDLRWTGRALDLVNSGFATAVDTDILCTSLVSHVVDLHMLEMKADGFINQAWEEYYRWTADQSCSVQEPSDDDSSDPNDDSTRLGVYEMGGIFLFHGILCAISMLIATFQYYQNRSFSKSNEALDDSSADSDDRFVDNAIDPWRKSPLRRGIWNSSQNVPRQSMWEPARGDSALVQRVLSSVERNEVRLNGASSLARRSETMGASANGTLGKSLDKGSQMPKVSKNGHEKHHKDSQFLRHMVEEGKKGDLELSTE